MTQMRLLILLFHGCHHLSSPVQAPASSSGGRQSLVPLAAGAPRVWDAAAASPTCRRLGLEHPRPSWIPPAAAMGMLETRGRENPFSCTPAHTPPSPGKKLAAKKLTFQITKGPKCGFKTQTCFSRSRLISGSEQEGNKRPI